MKRKSVVVRKKKPIAPNFTIEFSNEVFEIPYNENIKKNSKNNEQFTDSTKTKKKKARNLYKIQFIIFSSISVIFLFILFLNLINESNQEKVSEKLLDNYRLTTLYSTNNDYEAQKTSYENPFVIGLIRIPKINLNYPILSESNKELLQISLCRFAGPMPNKTRKFVHCWA